MIRAAIIYALIISKYKARFTHEDGNVHQSSFSLRRLLQEPSGESYKEYFDKNGNPENWSPVPEPNPDFNTAIPLFGVAWYLHIYIFFSMYLFLFISSILILVDLIKSWENRSKPLTLSLTICLFVLSIFRVIILLVDPYNSRNLISDLAWRILWVLPFPALTTAFFVVLVVLMDTTKMTIGPPRFQRISFILSVSAIHVGIVMGSELLVYFLSNLYMILYACQILTSLWGLFLCVGYAIVGVKIHINLKASLNPDLRRNSDTGQLKLYRLRRYIFLSAVTGLSYTITGLYGAIGVYGIFATGDEIQPWPWWTYQSFSRLSELATCALIIAVAMRTAFVNVFEPLRNIGLLIREKVFRMRGKVDSEIILRKDTKVEQTLHTSVISNTDEKASTEN